MTPLEQHHFDLLTKWRKAMDLVGPGPLEPHFEDARRAVAWLEPTGSWVDLGSGAGFPGVALAAHHPDLRVLLVESRSKRAAFLDQVARTAPNLSVRCTRSEKLEDGAFDGVISRAYRPPEDFLADARRLLQAGGTAVVMLARQEPPRVDGLEMFHVEHYNLGGRPRAAVGYRKTG
ncbi:MAG: methyltransferase domain-containing protein [Proteobacteria bacterium]|nr:methyltransferase domain-containing protein [Pseudomonadota bacterium]